MRRTPMLAEFGRRAASGRRARRRPRRPRAPAASWSARTSAGSTASVERGVGQAGVHADLGVAVAAPLQVGNVGGLGGIIIPGAHARGSRAARAAGPGAVQARRDVLLVLLVAAMVAEEEHLAHAVLAQAARGALPAATRTRRRESRCVPAKRMCAGRRVDRAFRHVGHDRRHDRVAQRARRSGRPARGRARCACPARCAARSARCRRSAPAR